MLDFSNDGAVAAHCVSWFQCQCNRFSTKEVTLKVIFLKFKAPSSSKWTSFQANSTVMAAFHSVSCIICYLPKWKRKRGWCGRSHSPTAPHRVPIHRFPIQSGNLCLCCGMKGGGIQPQGEIFPAETTCALWAAREARLLGMAAGMAQCFCALESVFQADTVNVCLAYWNMVVVHDSPEAEALAFGKIWAFDETYV